MIGVYGGTFDPVHFGHLRPALDLMQDLALDEIRFLPCRSPSHRAAPRASAAQRLAMLRLALEGNEDGLRIDERELGRAGPSYTVDTLLSLRAERGAEPLALILGMDALQGLSRWHRWQELIGLSHIVVMRRPGWPVPDHGEMAAWLRRRWTDDPDALRGQPAGRVLVCDVTQLDVAASRIRALVAAGFSPRYLLPEAVREYIQDTRLYRSAET